jgi:tight adherence protein B
VSPFGVASVVTVIGIALIVARGTRRRAILNRVEGESLDREQRALLPEVEKIALGRKRWAPLGAGLLAYAGFHSIESGPWIALGGAVLVTALISQLESILFTNRQVRYESQLAETLDLVVGALRAGVGIVDALAAGSSRVANPLRSLLLDIVERLRIGDDPVETLTSLGRRVPLETYRLTSLTLGASWEGGGGYAEALSGVGRTTRERLALRRRLNSQSVEARVSVLVLLVVTWGLLAVAYLRDPIQAQAFVSSTMGEAIVAGVLLLQALGLIWIDSMVRIEP